MSGSTSSHGYGYPLEVEVGEWATRQNDPLRSVDSTRQSNRACIANTASWGQNAGLNAWLSQCRPNSQNAIMRGMRPDDTAKLALLKESGAKAAAAAAMLSALLATLT